MIENNAIPTQKNQKDTSYLMLQVERLTMADSIYPQTQSNGMIAHLSGSTITITKLIHKLFKN